MKQVSIFFLLLSVIACNNPQKKLIGKWQYERSEIKVDSKDTSKVNSMKMEEFVTQLALQNTDLVFMNEGKFETMKGGEPLEKGKFSLNNKVLTLEYISKKENDLEDFEVLALTDSTMKLRNSSNMIIDYKKTAQ